MSCGGITILGNPDKISVGISPEKITIQMSPDKVSIEQSPDVVQVQQVIQMVRVCVSNRIPSFRSFYFVATQGQTVFTLPGVALSVMLVAINGTAQSQAGGDFTVAENVLTLEDGVDAGDKVFGVIQVV